MDKATAERVIADSIREAYEAGKRDMIEIIIHSLTELLEKSKETK